MSQERIPLPPAFLSRMRELLSEDYPAFLQSYDRPASVRGLRLCGGLSKESAEAALPFRLSPVPYEERGYYITEDNGERVGNHPLHQAGGFYMQDPGAMMPVACLAGRVSPGMRVLDLCAAPGGKSSQIYPYLGEEGFLVSNDISAARAKAMVGNMERLGLKSTAVTCLSPDELTGFYGAFFDIVIVDAPCSGEGMFRKDTEAITVWSEEKVAACAAEQRKILDSAAALCKAGGYILYSTCTFSKEEDEMAVAYLMKKHGFSPLPLPAAVVAVTACGHLSEEDGTDCIGDAALVRRFYPHTGEGEGQFAALLQREGMVTDNGIGALTVQRSPQKQGKNKKASHEKEALRPLSTEEQRAVEAFLADTFTTPPTGAVRKYNDNLILLSPYAPPLPTRGVFAAGVKLGELQKGRVVPHHALFAAYGDGMKRRLYLSSASAEAESYLRGLELPQPADMPAGYGAVLIDGIPLGGFKAAAGALKNHYPKGLRRP